MAGLGDSVGGPQAQGNDGREPRQPAGRPGKPRRDGEDWIAPPPEPVQGRPRRGRHRGQPAPVTRPETAVPRPLQPPLPPDAPGRRPPRPTEPCTAAARNLSHSPPRLTRRGAAPHWAAASSPRPVERPAGAAPQPPPAAASAPQPARRGRGSAADPPKGPRRRPAAYSPGPERGTKPEPDVAMGPRIMAGSNVRVRCVQASGPGSCCRCRSRAAGSWPLRARVSRSFGNPSLDAAALSAVQAPPDGLSQPRPMA